MVSSKKPSSLNYVTLCNGDRLSQLAFHRVYCGMPNNYRAELIGGLVFEPSPVGWPHSSNHACLVNLLTTYSMHTEGVDVGDNATVILGKEDEVQPDVVLRIRQNCGGKSRINRKKFVLGPPELVVEIANSSKAIDLHIKKDRYQRAGVLEYMVLCLQPKSFVCFDLRNGRETRAKKGIVKSIVYPGLWISVSGLLKEDKRECNRVLQLGLQSRKHAIFVEGLRKQIET